MKEFIPFAGMLTGVIIPISVFVWLYLADKNKNQTMIEMAKHIDDPEEIKALLRELNNDNKPQKPIDYRRSGVMTLFAGIGLFLFGVFLIAITDQFKAQIPPTFWASAITCNVRVVLPEDSGP